MLRRLFFLVPDELHAVEVMSDIETRGIDRSHIHAVPGQGIKLTTLPLASERQQHDAGGQLERVVWLANLGLFALAFGGFAWGVFTAHLGVMVAALVVTGLTFFGGAWFVMKVPDTHLTEFREALKHREIVLMVDVPRNRAGEIDNLVRHRHPEAISGGIGWTIETLGI